MAGKSKFPTPNARFLKFLDLFKQTVQRQYRPLFDIVQAKQYREQYRSICITSSFLFVEQWPLGLKRQTAPIRITSESMYQTVVCVSQPVRIASGYEVDSEWESRRESRSALIQV